MNFGAAVGKLSVLVAALLFGLVCHAAELPAAQWSSDEYKNLTLRQHRTCVENEQYPHQGFCCLNCQAGTFVHKECERDQEQGTCLSCEHGQTYTEHSNGMNRCLPCTHCRLDEIETASCTTTTDTRCQCRPGTFCVPDQACEVCKRCAKCKPGEEEVKKCTPFSNTVCQKRYPSPTKSSPPPSETTPTAPADIVGPICISLVLILLFIILIGLAVWWFKCKQHSCEIPCLKSHSESSEIVKIPIDESGATAEERQNNQNAGLEGEESRPESRPLLQETQGGMTKASPPLEDEDRGLGDSLPNTTSSSQTSLSALPTAASSGNTPHQSPAAFRLQPADMEDPLQHRLLPLLGTMPSVCFCLTYVLSLCLGLLCLLFVTFWSSHWRGGFSWDGSALEFNWHPVLMVSGLLVLYGYAVVVYRLPFTWSQKKHIWKLVHAGLMLLALVLSVLGLCAVFDFHRGIQVPHLYSLHSWVGICTVVLFAVQWVLGLGGFLLPCSPLWIRSSLKPVHSWMGKAILILSVTACISGITEKLLFTLNGDSTEPYSSLPAEAKFVNSLGLLIVAFGLVTFGILSNKKWQRPEEDAESVQPLLNVHSP